jgi:predicted MFS family arabinose efflux permease
VAVIATGLFVTGLGWPGIIGLLPLQLLLKNQLHLAPSQVASFWALTTLGWYVKPIVALVVDAYPLGGRRRRGYLVAGTGAAGVLWLGFAFVPRSLGALQALTLALNLALVLVSAAVGGLLVETGQRLGATGRLSSLREAIVGIIAVAGGPIAGWLGTRDVGWTGVAGAAVLFAYLLVVVRCNREPRGPRASLDRAVVVAARAQLGTLVRSRAIWMTAGLLFLVNLAPGLQTPLFFHQQDVLHFGSQLIGNLQALGGAGALAGAAAYAVLCRRVSLRTSMIAGILLNTASTLFYLAYDSTAAAVAITSSAAVMGTLATLPLFDLAARATPRGSETLGYALLLTVYTLSLNLSNVIGSHLYERFHMGFKELVWVNAGSTAAVLLFVPFLPRALLARAEGRMD